MGAALMIAALKPEAGLHGDHDAERDDRDADLAGCPDDERIEALAAHRAEVGREADARERQQKRPARQVRQVGGLRRA